MKKLFLLGIVISVALSGIFALDAFLFSKDAQGTVITLTKKGFVPKDITIRVGDTVTFKTELGEYFWPASDLHPSHSTLPDFDPLDALSPEDTWSFTFRESGVWGFHDHVAPYFIGSVTVLPLDGGELLEGVCDIEKNALSCWQKDVSLVYENEGLDKAFLRIGALYEEFPSFRGACHYITHNIGLQGYQEYLKDEDSIFSDKVSSCASGFLHGFMEGFLGGAGSPEDAADFCEKVGEKLSSVVPDAEYQCFHGIGHGAIETVLGRNKDLDRSDDAFVNRALSLCEQASRESEHLYRCTSGVFNGIANFYIRNEYGFSIDENNPLRICHEQPDTYKESCYGNMNSVLDWQAQGNLSLSLPFIEKIEDGDLRDRTLWYLSALRVTRYLKNPDFKALLSECRELPEIFQNACTEGTVHGFLEHGSPGTEYEKARALCEEGELPEEQYVFCMETLATSVGGWYSEEKTNQICQSLPEIFRPLCGPHTKQ